MYSQGNVEKYHIERHIQDRDWWLPLDGEGFDTWGLFY